MKKVRALRGRIYYIKRVWYNKILPGKPVNINLIKLGENAWEF